MKKLFKEGEIVSHTSNISKFYRILTDMKNGQYRVVELDPNFFDVNEEFVFMGIYLLTKEDRRDHCINELLIYKK